MIADTAFLLIATVTLAAGFLAVWLKNVFYNALALILCLFGVACIFVFLNSEFLAVMEVIIYIGAISIAIIFAIMLSRPMYQKDTPRGLKRTLGALVISGLFFAGLWKALSSARWADAGTEGDYSLKAIGHNLLSQSLLPFEAVSLVLLVAIVGALVISTTKEGRG